MSYSPTNTPRSGSVGDGPPPLFTQLNYCRQLGKPTPGPRSPGPRTGCPRFLPRGQIADPRPPGHYLSAWQPGVLPLLRALGRATVIQLKRGLHCSHSSSCSLQLLRQVLQCRQYLSLLCVAQAMLLSHLLGDSTAWLGQHPQTACC